MSYLRFKMQDNIASKKVRNHRQATCNEARGARSHHVNANKVRRAAESENDLSAFLRLTILSIPYNDCLHIYFESHQYNTR
jgi:hypothetical protein